MSSAALDRRRLIVLGIAFGVGWPAAGAAPSVTLGDGTHLWREPGAVLRVDVVALLRRVALDAGGVVLQPPSDRRPFVVDLPFARLHVAGACCRVRCYGDVCELAVFSGAVDVAPVAGRTHRVAAGNCGLRVVRLTGGRL